MGQDQEIVPWTQTTQAQVLGCYAQTRRDLDNGKDCTLNCNFPSTGVVEANLSYTTKAPGSHTIQPSSPGQ